MDIGKIEKLLQSCNLPELHEIEKILAELIKETEDNFSLWDDEEGRKRRIEDRFETNIAGTLRRITDIRPGERKEFSVTITDISRSGICLKTSTGFIPSRAVEVTFAGPGGKSKRCFLQVVRMRKIINRDKSWLEVGCSSIDEQQVNQLLLQEERAARMRKKLRKKKDILIVVEGAETENTNKLVSRIKLVGYRVTQVQGRYDAIKIAKQVSAQLVIFCEDSELLEDSKFLSELSSHSSRLATMIIVKNEEERFELFNAGVDECLTYENLDEYLFYAIERAMVGHVARFNMNKHARTLRVLLVSSDNTHINLITYSLEENGYRCRVSHNLTEAEKLLNQPFDLIFADFNPDAAEEFQKFSKLSNRPLIALCEQIGHGYQAVVSGASNYLCMPPGKEDVRMILESAALSPELFS